MDQNGSPAYFGIIGRLRPESAPDLASRAGAPGVERLIASLDADPGIEEAWAAEVERRHAEIETGAVPLISGPEALAKLKAEFR